MSQPRVTVTVRQDGQRSASISSNKTWPYQKYGGIIGRKRSVKDRLGGGFMSNKRQRLEINKRQPNRWEDEQAIVASTNSPSNGQRRGQDLRQKLHQKHKQNQHISNASTIVGNDLRARISGSIPQGQGQRIVVHRHPPIPTKPLPLVGPLSPPNAITSHVKPLQKVEQPTVGMLLQSLGLGKYSITFQAEEIDMTALRNMNDDDLKELGLPMGPRKKILLALSRK